MSNPRIFLYLGVIAAIMAAILSIVGSDLNANGLPQSAHPLSGVGLALTSLAFLKAYELTR